MTDRKIQIPLVYRKMDERGYTDAQSDSYAWLYEMEWSPIDKILEYEHEEGESESVIPFAHTGAGDKWVWVISDDGEEYAVGLCECAETTGIYYAKNTEDAILRQIIEYAASSDFYLDEEEAESYQISETELKVLLEKWKTIFRGIIRDEYINVIDMLCGLSLKHIECKYGEWYALLTPEEEAALIDRYIGFDLLDDEFEWFVD